MAKKRFCFMRDDDCHNYLIPAEMKEEFDRLLYGDEADESAFTDKFGDMRTGCSVSCFSFEDPKCDL